MVLLFALVALKFGVIPILRKKIAEESPSGGRVRRLQASHAVSFVLAVVVALVSGHVDFAPELMLLGLYGILSSVASYAQWRATAENQAAVATFSQLDDLVAIGLAILFFGEAQLLTIDWGVGSTLCFAAGGLLLFAQRKKNREGCVGRSGLPLDHRLFRDLGGRLARLPVSRA